jgi:tryptophanyl-tRNA synthetase
MPTKGRILTGHRPTGRRHLGHLLGTLQTWARLQEEYECFFLIANYHVLTTDYEHPEHIPENVRHVLLDWLAAGIDPQRSTILLQSAVPEHAELALLLGMLVSVPRLERNPTYKEQVQQLGLVERASLGLLAYPVLQAADILAYQADTVPVGEDQLPHLELAREMARRFNTLYGELFPEPQPLLSTTPRLPGTDGRTMHTSYDNTIPLSADPPEIQDKVWGMVTDPARIHPHDPGHPEICPVNQYHQALEPEKAERIAAACRQGQIPCVEHKEGMAGLLVERLEPYRRIRQEMAGHEDDLWDILRQGSLRARALARKTLSTARACMGVPNLGVAMERASSQNVSLDLAGKVCC